MATNAAIKKDAQALAAELDELRCKLTNEIKSEAKISEAHGAECRRLACGEAANVLSSKQQLDVAISRIDGIKAEIAEKHRVLDELAGLEAEEDRRQRQEQEFARATERLAETQAEIAKLKAEYFALPEKIRVAEWQFHEALRIFNNVAKAGNASTTPRE